MTQPPPLSSSSVTSLLAGKLPLTHSARQS